MGGWLLQTLATIGSRSVESENGNGIKNLLRPLSLAASKWKVAGLEN